MCFSFQNPSVFERDGAISKIAAGTSPGMWTGTLPAAPSAWAGVAPDRIYGNAEERRCFFLKEAGSVEPNTTT